MLATETEKLSELYDEFYNEFDKILKQYAPCKITKENDKISCVGQIAGKWNTNKLCCELCRGFWDNGCTIICLGCKIWLCEAAKKNLPKSICIKWENLDKKTYELDMSISCYRPKPEWWEA